MATRLVVGADVGGTNVKYMLGDTAGLDLHRGEVPTDPHDPGATIDRLASTIREHASQSLHHVEAFGLACAGIVSPASGLLGRSPNLPGWEGCDLVDLVRTAFRGTAIAVANDVNAALYGEYRQGAGRGCRHLVMIALGTGVGGGVLIDGRLLTGHADGAGEIGHMTLELDGEQCSCGNTGCLEAYCGSVSLLRRARLLGDDPGASEAWRTLVVQRGERLTTRDCCELAGSDDSTAIALFVAAGRRLGQAVSSLINVLAPERIIIGGGVAQAGELLLQPCREMVQEHVMSCAGRRTPILPAQLGPYAAAIGAAALAMESGGSP